MKSKEASYKMEEGPQPNLKLAVPFFMVTNMTTSLTFYEALGFTRKMEWCPDNRIEWCWLEREGVAIMLQEYRLVIKVPAQPGAGISICFICTDALQLYHDFSSAGLSPKEPFVGNRMWVVEILDPDGYKLNFESYTDVVEETTYREWIQKNGPSQSAGAH